MNAKIKTAVSSLARQYGAERVYLFGSYARGEETETSDIDLRIDKGNIRGLHIRGTGLQGGLKTTPSGG